MDENFHQLLTSLLSTDNDVRTQAEVFQSILVHSVIYFKYEMGEILAYLRCNPTLKRSGSNVFDETRFRVKKYFTVIHTPMASVFD
jgi:hypothetical protein